MIGLCGDFHNVVAVGSKGQRVAAKTADQLVVPVHGAAVVNAVEEAAILSPDGADAAVVILVGAVEGLPGACRVFCIGRIRAEGHEGINGLMGFLVALDLAELNMADGQHVAVSAFGCVADLKTDDRVFHIGFGCKHIGDDRIFTGGNIQAVEVGPVFPALLCAFHQGFAALAVGCMDGERIIVFLALFNLQAAQGHIGLDAPHTALGGIVVNGHDRFAVLKSSAGIRAVSGLGIHAFILGEISRVHGDLMFLTGNLVQFNLIDGHGEIGGRCVLGIVGVRGNLAQVEEQFSAAFRRRGERQFKRSNRLGDPYIECAVEGFPALCLFIARQDMGIGGFGGLGPDLDLVIRCLQRIARLGQLDITVTVARVLDVDHIGAVFQGGSRLSGLADLGFPALVVRHFSRAEIKGLVRHGFAGLLGDRQGGIALRGEAALIGHRIHELIAAGRFWSGFAVFKAQCRGGLDGNHPGQVAVLRIGGGKTGQGIKLGARFHGLIGSALNGRCRVRGFCRGGRGFRFLLAGAGRKAHDQRKKQGNDCNGFLHGHFLPYFAMKRS